MENNISNEQLLKENEQLKEELGKYKGKFLIILGDLDNPNDKTIYDTAVMFANSMINDGRKLNSSIDVDKLYQDMFRKLQKNVYDYFGEDAPKIIAMISFFTTNPQVLKNLMANPPKDINDVQNTVNKYLSGGKNNGK